MSSYWLKNFVGMKLTDYEKFIVPEPGYEFCIHVTLRSIQTGALLGSVLGPLSAMMFSDQKATSRNLRESFVSGGTNGALIGAALGPVMTYVALKNMSSASVYEKCLAQRFDQSQLWLDRSCVVSAAVGAVSGGSMGFVVGLDLALIMSNLMGKAWGN